MPRINNELLKNLIIFCDEFYQAHKKEIGSCLNCSHENRNCLGNCKSCLKELTWQNFKRTNYNCEKLAAYYVCKFLNKFASEIFYLLTNEKVEARLKTYNEFNILSLGCGPASDIIAFDAFIREVLNKPININYTGIDIACKWQYIHEKICQEVSSLNYQPPKFDYEDITKKILEIDASNTNIMVIKNLFSALIRTKNEIEMNLFLDNLANLISKMPKDSIVLINDINSRNLYRDKWLNIVNKIYMKRKIEYNIMVFGKNYEPCKWEQYYSNCLKFYFPENFDKQAYEYWTTCTSVQLFINIGE